MALQPKLCDTCGRMFRSTFATGGKEWAARRFCSLKCVRHKSPVMGLEAIQPGNVETPCKGSTADFFPRAGEYASAAAERLRSLALAYCAACPIRTACQEAGIRGEQGLWGGVLFTPDREPISLLSVAPATESGAA